jgi:hypothetical protein
MKLSADFLKKAIEAEVNLAKKDSQWRDETVDQLSDDNPIKQEANKQKMLLGDLAGLPPNHPLVLALEDARERYEHKKTYEENLRTESEKINIRRAKRLDDKKSRIEARRYEEEDASRKRNAAKTYNSSIKEAIDVIHRLRDNVKAVKGEFENNKYSMMKVVRLEKLLDAAERGFVESSINIGRVVNG